MSWNQTKSNIARGYLWICILTFIGLGIALLGWPDQILSKVDVIFETPTAFADIRADYGGCIFGLGLFLGWCGMRAERTRAGLLCSGLTFSGYAMGRILSFFIDGTPKRIIFLLLTFEVITALIAFGLIPMAPSQTVGPATTKPVKD